MLVFLTLNIFLGFSYFLKYIIQVIFSQIYDTGNLEGPICLLKCAPYKGRNLLHMEQIPSCKNSMHPFQSHFGLTGEAEARHRYCFSGSGDWHWGH